MIQIKVNGKIVGLYENEAVQTLDKLITAIKLHMVGGKWEQIIIEVVKDGTGNK